MISSLPFTVEGFVRVTDNFKYEEEIEVTGTILEIEGN